MVGRVFGCVTTLFGDDLFYYRYLHDPSWIIESEDPRPDLLEWAYWSQIAESEVPAKESAEVKEPETEPEPAPEPVKSASGTRRKQAPKVDDK